MSTRLVFVYTTLGFAGGTIVAALLGLVGAAIGLGAGALLSAFGLGLASLE